MPTIAARWRTLAPWFQGTLRIVAAADFMTHGTLKLFAIPAGANPAHTVELFSQMGLAGVLETFGGALMLLGVFTRPIAFVLSGEMAVAYFQAHFPVSVYPIFSGGEAPLLFCFIWLFYSAAGAGRLSLDEVIARRRGADTR